MSIAEPSKFGLRRMDVAVTRSHGSGYVLDMSETALLVIDMFNTYSHPTPKNWPRTSAKLWVRSQIS